LQVPEWLSRRSIWVVVAKKRHGCGIVIVAGLSQLWLARIVKTVTCGLLVLVNGPH
jgi:hypothetical protein